MTPVDAKYWTNLAVIKAQTTLERRACFTSQREYGRTLFICVSVNDLRDSFCEIGPEGI
jgi:hypothetical protein